MVKIKNVIIIFLILIIVIIASFTIFKNPFLFSISFIGLVVYSVYLITKPFQHVKKEKEQVAVVNNQVQTNAIIEDEDESENLEYINNLSISQEESYIYPNIESDYKEKIEHINNIIQNIENKQFNETTFIQKENYKIRYKDELNQEEILLLTFTRKASKEMLDRTKKIIRIKKYKYQWRNISLFRK